MVVRKRWFTVVVGFSGEVWSDGTEGRVWSERLLSRLVLVVSENGYGEGGGMVV